MNKPPVRDIATLAPVYDECGLEWTSEPHDYDEAREFQIESSASEIVTESDPVDHVAWRRSFDVLLAELTSQRCVQSAGFIPPTTNAVKSALKVLQGRRKAHPTQPPTVIAREPAGGIIVEWHADSQGNDRIINEFTFYNDGTIEFTYYRNGKIELMEELQFEDVG